MSIRVGLINIQV